MWMSSEIDVGVKQRRCGCQVHKAACKKKYLPLLAASFCKLSRIERSFAKLCRWFLRIHTGLNQRVCIMKRQTSPHHAPRTPQVALHVPRTLHEKSYQRSEERGTIGFPMILTSMAQFIYLAGHRSSTQTEAQNG